MVEAAKILEGSGVDAIDVNLGCPQAIGKRGKSTDDGSWRVNVILLSTPFEHYHSLQLLLSPLTHLETNQHERADTALSSVVELTLQSRSSPP